MTGMGFPMAVLTVVGLMASSQLEISKKQGVGVRNPNYFLGASAST